MTLSIVPVEPKHVAPIALNLRQADRDEIKAGDGGSPAEAIRFSLAKSDVARTILIDGRPVAIFGCGGLNVLAGIGMPWMLGTDEIEEAPLAFLRASMDWRDRLLTRYSVLRNLIDDRNTVSIEWLRWLGFDVGEPFEAGPNRMPFRMFEMRR